MLFVHYFCGVLLLCLMLIQLANADLISISFVSMLCTSIAIISQNFINCFYGNKIKIESGRISETAYFSNWQNLGRDSYKVKKYILLLMVRSHEPILISIGKFAYLDLETFVTIAKASYSYFNFLARTQ